MRLMARGNEDDTIKVINVAAIDYDSDTKEMYVYSVDGDCFIIEGVDDYDYNSYAINLYSTGKVDISSTYKGYWSEDDE